MRISITASKNFENIYILRDIYINPTKRKTVIHKALGRMDKLMDELQLDRDGVIQWARNCAAEETEKLKEENETEVIKFDPNKMIPMNQKRMFNISYLFLQSIYYSLRFKNTFRNIKAKYKYEYDLDAITSDLIYSRILNPSSKLSSYDYAQSFIEPPKYQLKDVYRGLSILAKEMDYIQAETYKNSNLIINRDHSILYYDCTNYFFEIEEADDLRKYGKSKEHRPNPIVQMGMFMDKDGIPLAFSLFPGNESEQPSAKELEQKIIRNYGFEKFIYCSDAGLGSDNNRQFNDIENRAFIVTQSIKKLKAEEKEWALSSNGWRRLSDDKHVKIKDTQCEYDTEIYYKEEPYSSKKVASQRMIVTYSPKYAAYQKKIREAQIDRANEMIIKKTVKKERRNPNDPARFVNVVKTTKDGEVAETSLYSLDEKKVLEEARYDGLYAICTDLLDDDVRDIIKVSEGRWEIEENFRILKTNMGARPVYLQREDRIKAHFLICYLSLLIFRILEKKLDGKYTVEQIIKTLRGMNVMKIEGHGYLPAYDGTEITNALHEAFGFRTDTEVIKLSKMKNIIKQTRNS
jgi:transposase